METTESSPDCLRLGGWKWRGDVYCLSPEQVAGWEPPRRGCVSLVHEFVLASPVHCAGSWQGRGCFNPAKWGLVSRHHQGRALGQDRSPVRV